MPNPTQATNASGLKNKMQALHTQLNTLRKGGHDFVINDVLTGKVKVEIQKGNPIKFDADYTLDHLMHDIGIDPHTMTVQHIMDLPEDQRWIVPEFFLQEIEQGMRQNNDFYQALIAGTVTRDTQTFEQPEISIYSEANQGLVGDGGVGTTPDSGEQVAFTTRSLRTSKFERKIEIPQEVTRYSTLDQLRVFLSRMAKIWGLQQTRRAIEVLLNGDVTSGAMAAATIGSETGTELSWVDLTRIAVRMGRLGFNTPTVVTTEGGVVNILNLTEFKENQSSGRMLGEARVQGVTMGRWDIWAHSTLEDTGPRYLFLDPAYAIQELVSQGLRVESERLMNRDMDATYVRIQNGYANIYREARVIVDPDVAFSGAGFPSWMDPID